MSLLTLTDCERSRDRFETKIDRSRGPEGCHPHTCGLKNPDGYGAFRLTTDGETRTVGIHRVAYVLATGESLSSVDYIDHVVCHDPRCCNPKHLRRTDALGNASNMRRSDRASKRSGSRLFTDQEVMDLRARWAGGEPLSSLVANSGVKTSTIRKIIQGKTYKNLPILIRPATLTPMRSNQLLTSDQVAIIKRQLLTGVSQAAIGRAYGVPRGVINAIATGRTWKSVDPAPDRSLLPMAAD